MKISTDKFNTDIFGLKMGNIDGVNTDESEKEVKEIIYSARSEGYQHLNVKIPTAYKGAVNSFLRNGFDLVDTQIMYSMNTQILQRERSGSDTILYRNYSENDKEAIVNIAKAAYCLDQYHSDPSLRGELCDQYYAKWAGNCCDGLADKVMVVSLSDHSVAGYLTLNYKGETATVGLAAVDERFRGQGCFTVLIEKTLRMLQAEGVFTLYYGTQLSNLPVLKVMGRFGGKVIDSNHVMHLLLQRMGLPDETGQSWR